MGRPPAGRGEISAGERSHRYEFDPDCRGLARQAPTGAAFRKPVAGSVGTVIGAFKSAVTKRINELRGTPGAAVWQRNYFERIVRDEREMANIRHYIRTNSERWASDRENPERTADHDPEPWE